MAQLDLRRRRLEAEVAFLEPIYGPIEYDLESWRWLMVLQFPLPPGLQRPYSAVLIDLPRAYPAVAPHGVYLDRDLPLNDHFFAHSIELEEYHQQGWAWLCLHEERHHSSSWHPAAKAADGDNLYSILLLVSAMLQALT
jgi:hypothetical protein